MIEEASSQEAEGVNELGMCHDQEFEWFKPFKLVNRSNGLNH